MDSPRFDSPSPQFSDCGTPRFTEHFNASPPYSPIQGFHGHERVVPNYGYHTEETVVNHKPSEKERQFSYSDKERQYSQHSPIEVVQSLPESYRYDYEEKEVVLPSVQPVPADYERHSIGPPPRRKSVCGVPPVWFWTALGVLFVLVAAGVGLGVGLSMKHRSSSSPGSTGESSVDVQYLIGGAINPAYYSSSGAYNGSGIALASQSFSRELADGTQGNLVMYFQHHSGEIRYEQLSNSGEWLGGDFSTVVAQDAKNNTPLSAVAYVSGGSSQWHIFYIDQNNTLKQRSNSNTTNVWTDGAINDLNLKTFAADSVGMQACWYGNDYGDSDYAHSPLPNEDSNATFSQDIGMHMWYASDATTFQQYGWRDGDSSWNHQGSWENKNGHAGVGCYSWGAGTVGYVMFVNLENSVEFWWKDTNANLTNTTSHPINVWTNTSIAINNVQPATSLGYTNAFYAQLNDDLMIHGYNISWNAENTTIITEDSFTVQGDPGLPGTHLSVSALPNNSGGNNLVVFYQTNGSDISEYTRDLIAGQWSEVTIDIPDT